MCINCIISNICSVYIATVEILLLNTSRIWLGLTFLAFFSGGGGPHSFGFSILGLVFWAQTVKFFAMIKILAELWCFQLIPCKWVACAPVLVDLGLSLAPNENAGCLRSTKKNSYHKLRLCCSPLSGPVSALVGFQQLLLVAVPNGVLGRCSSVKL